MFPGAVLIGVTLLCITSDKLVVPGAGVMSVKLPVVRLLGMVGTVALLYTVMVGTVTVPTTVGTVPTTVGTVHMSTVDILFVVPEPGKLCKFININEFVLSSKQNIVKCQSYCSQHVAMVIGNTACF